MALQILRFHLIELRKVQELCDTFCHKYITTLKHKLQADQLPPVYDNGEDSDDSGSGSSKSGHHQFSMSHSPDPSILAARYKYYGFGAKIQTCKYKNFKKKFRFTIEHLLTSNIGIFLEKSR